MRRILGAAILMLVVWSATAQDKAGLTVGKNIPSTFHPYNITMRTIPSAEPDGKTAEAPRSTVGKYHCLITAYDLDPVVMLVVRDAEDLEGVKHLLQQLDGLVVRNTDARLRAFVVFLFESQKLDNVVTMDDVRDQVAKQVAGLKDTLNLKGVVLTVGGLKDPGLTKFGFNNNALNAVLYRNLKVVALHSLDRDKLEEKDSPDIQKLLDDVKTKLKASR